jgi:hypothetical protein
MKIDYISSVRISGEARITVYIEMLIAGTESVSELYIFTYRGFA